MIKLLLFVWIKVGLAIYCYNTDVEIGKSY
jgi:hypothetical protein